MNLWHDLSVGDKAPEEIRVVVEIPRGAINKYELDKETGMIALDRVSHSSMAYPFEYAFAPQTLWEDGDALDVIILATEPFFPGLLVDVRPVAVMRMIDSGEGDDKIIAVPVVDPRWAGVKDLADINPQTIKIIQHFHENYKKLQNKVVTISGFEGRDQAFEAVKKGMQMYADKFGKK